MAEAILLISTVVQYAAAIFALRLVKSARRKFPWLCVTTAILLMAFRRTISLARAMSGDPAHQVDAAAESVALLISLLMLTGVVLLGHGRDEEEPAAAGRMHALVAKLTLAFVLLCGAAWANELLDLPHVILGARATPVNWREAAFETMMAMLVGLYVVWVAAAHLSARLKSEERLKHLNRVLAAVRNVNQLITREKDRGRLLAGACRSLTDAQGFSGTCIVLVNQANTYEAAATAGMDDALGENFRHELEDGRFPQCVRSALKKAGREIITGPGPECGECAFRFMHGGSATFVTALTHDTRTYGVLIALLPPELESDEEARSLFLEVAGDIAFALDSMELDKLHAETRQELDTSRSTLEAIFNGAIDGILVANTEKGRFMEANAAICRMLGYTRGEILGLSVTDIHPKDRLEYVQGEFRKQAAGEITLAKDIPVLRKDGSVFHADVNSAPVELAGKQCLLGLFRDTTKRMETERALQDTREQLQQAQKLESVGRLAGGVAHDFNNLLTVILGYCETLKRMNEGNGETLKRLEVVKHTAERAAGLVHQLLAFSRKQVLQLRRINMNTAVEAVGAMLKRTIGEDIETEFRLQEGLWPVKADAGQMEQVIMNLAVNARDAMPQGGKLTIETRNVELDEAYAAERPEVQPGPHVMLAISDNGHGMNKETMKRVFEPFFTTKEMGKGTGLGLSTVYGIVKQSGGHIWVYSEPGKGTTFKIYLPRTDAADSARPAAEAENAEDSRGSETILVVEDDNDVRSLVCGSLGESGYTVLQACSAEEALARCEELKGSVSLMLTDVIMPGMSGVELARTAKEMCPGIKVIYTSGYTDNAIVHHGVLNEGVEFIEKPFTLNALNRRIRQVLDSGESS
ncbi:MAG: PAS domain S-box protein [Planctomycetes bacterium]|nr:PAS domain S-box protein [Planctomycetota bacterium]